MTRAIAPLPCLRPRGNLQLRRNLGKTLLIRCSGQQSDLPAVNLQFWCPGPELNRHGTLRFLGILSPVCLPIPPPGHGFTATSREELIPIRRVALSLEKSGK